MRGIVLTLDDLIQRWLFEITNFLTIRVWELIYYQNDRNSKDNNDGDGQTNDEQNFFLQNKNMKKINKYIVVHLTRECHADNRVLGEGGNGNVSSAIMCIDNEK